MPLKNYSLLVGNVDDYLAQDFQPNTSLHFEIKVRVNSQFFYRIATDVWSSDLPHPLKYLIIENYQNPIVNQIVAMAPGMHTLSSRPKSLALDYVRGNLFDVKTMKIAPQLGGDNSNPLDEYIQDLLVDMRGQDRALIYAFGESWLNPNDTDQYFSFSPEQGIHQIHMNQGNGEDFASENGIYQDGAMFLSSPSNKGLTALFFAFETQSFNTDSNGNPIN